MTTENNGTAGKAAASGSAVGNSKGYYNTNGKLVLGETEELGSNVFKFNSKDAPEYYIHTKEAIAHYAGVNYGKNMRMLVKNGEEKKFTKPTLEAPKKKKGQEDRDPSPGELEEFKMELSLYHKEKKEYNEQKQKLFVVILGQCTRATKNKLFSDSKFKTLEQEDDVVGLLEKLEQLAFSGGGVKDIYLLMVESLRRLLALNQGPGETTPNWHRRFLAVWTSTTTLFGPLVPMALMTDEDDTPELRDRLQESLQSMMFLLGSDKKRFGDMMAQMNNNHIAKKEGAQSEYPRTLDAALDLLSQYQGQQGSGQNGSDNKETDTTGMETSFAQKGNKQLRWLKCHQCGELGHFKKDCPLNKRNHSQQQEKESSDEEESQGSKQSASRKTKGWGSFG